MKNLVKTRRHGGARQAQSWAYRRQHKHRLWHPLKWRRNQPGQALIEQLKAAWRKYQRRESSI